MMFSLKRPRRIDYPIPAQADFEAGLEQVLDTGAGELRYVFKTPQDRQLILDGAKEFFREFSRKEICLSDGRTAYFRPDLRAFDRGAVTAWAEYCIHSVTSSGKKIPGKDFAERIYNHHKRENMDRIEPIIREENVFGKFNNQKPEYDAVIFTGSSNRGNRLEIITRLDDYGNINADLTEVTVLLIKKNLKYPPHRPLTEVVEAVAFHQGAGYPLPTINNLQHENEKVKSDLQKNINFQGKEKNTMQTTPEMYQLSPLELTLAIRAAEAQNSLEYMYLVCKSGTISKENQLEAIHLTSLLKNDPELLVNAKTVLEVRRETEFQKFVGKTVEPAAEKSVDRQEVKKEYKSSLLVALKYAVDMAVYRCKAAIMAVNNAALKNSLSALEKVQVQVSQLEQLKDKELNLQQQIAGNVPDQPKPSDEDLLSPKMTAAETRGKKESADSVKAKI